MRGSWLPDRLRGWWKQLRGLFDKAALERELDEELAYHVERETEANVAAGMDPAAARRRAELEFRGRERYKEEVRDARWTRLAEDFVSDVGYGLRSLRQRPGFAAAAVLTLGLAIGATVAIVSVVKPVLFEPLPYPDSGRLVSITDVAPDGAPLPAAFGTVVELGERSRSFEALAAYRSWRPTLTGAGRPERLDGQRVGADYFRALDVRPALGRHFTHDDDRASGPDVVIIDHGLWRARFGGDPDIVGRRITLDSRPFTVVGVLPASFENVTASTARVWAPLQYDATLPSFEGREWGHHLDVLARLRPGVEVDAAGTELDRIAGDPLPVHPRPAWASLGGGLRVAPLRDTVTRAARPTLLAVFGAVVLLLVIGCVNVTNLLLARGVGRREELAMRTALGAGRGRLIRQLLTESLLLSAVGGAVGLGLAVLGVRGLVAVSPPGQPRLSAVHVDPTALVVAVAVTTFVGVVVGLVPAVRAARTDPRSAIQERSPTAGAHHRARGTLVAAEVALTFVLLIGAGLLLRSVDRLLAVDTGFAESGVLALQVQTSGDRLADDDAIHRYFDQVLAAVRAVPGVADGALTSQLPLTGEADRYGVRRPDVELPADPRRDAGVYRYAVAGRYFRTLGVPLRRGRVFDDGGADQRVAVISESLARRHFAGTDPIGRPLHVGRPDLPPYTVIGVVADVRQLSLAAGPDAGVYVPRRQWYFADGAPWIAVRTNGQAAALTAAVRAAIWSVDADQPIVRVATTSELVRTSAATQRFALALFQLFALVALALSAIGIYGLLAGTVGERRREIGVRVVLGASRRDVVAMVLGHGLGLAAIGAAIGLVAAVLGSRALSSLLFGVSRLDPLTYAGAVTVVGAVAAAACAVPAWRAGRVDPAITLRAE